MTPGRPALLDPELRHLFSALRVPPARARAWSECGDIASEAIGHAARRNSETRASGPVSVGLLAAARVRGGGLGAMGMQVEQLVETAVARAGSDDFGGDTWREGLDVLVDSLTAESALNELGESVMIDQIVGLLVNRLEVEQWYARHPEIAEQEIVAPLFGLGLPRTGSTALSFLLASDTARRSLRTWEAGKPCPPPETATEHTDPRIAETQVGIDMTNEMFPDFVGMLPTSATGPQECILLMALDFRSQLFEGMARIPTYSSWLLSLRHGARVSLSPARPAVAAVALPAGAVVAQDAGAHALD